MAGFVVWDRPGLFMGKTDAAALKVGGQATGQLKVSIAPSFLQCCFQFEQSISPGLSVVWSKVGLLRQHSIKLPYNAMEEAQTQGRMQTGKQLTGKDNTGKTSLHATGGGSGSKGLGQLGFKELFVPARHLPQFFAGRFQGRILLP